MNLNMKGLYKVGYALQKAAPTILMSVGTVGVVASTVLACKATLKVNETLEEHKKYLEIIEEAKEKGETRAGFTYTEKDAQKDILMMYPQTGVKLAKLYGPSVLLGVGSLGCMLYSHRIMTKRNLALGAAFTAVDQTFKGYRKNLVERFGKEVDKEMRTGIKAIESEVVETDENGETKVTKKKNIVVDKEGIVYEGNDGIWFDARSKYFQKSRDLNFLFVRNVEQACNRILKRKGRITLNEVLDRLGYPLREDGQYIGWIYDKSNPIGDNEVIFNIPVVNREEVFENYMDCVCEPEFWISFNHDGNILDKGW